MITLRRLRALIGRMMTLARFEVPTQNANELGQRVTALLTLGLMLAAIGCDGPFQSLGVVVYERHSGEVDGGPRQGAVSAVVRNASQGGG